MWYLINSTGKHIYLKPNEELTFGRKKSDILLQNDESISRLHASICIEPKHLIETNEPISICKLKDIGSKYGTYILSEGTEDRIEVPPEGYRLKDQDKIRFGLQDHIFTIVYVPIITVVSTLSDNDKNKLQSIMNEIDGMISMNWTSNCTDLTVSKATLTEKVIWAMASAIPIVTLSYWEKVKCAVNNGEELPKSEDFTPLIDESLVNKEVSLRPNNKRKTLFKHLIFVHFSPRQYKMYGKMISMAGGKSVSYSKNPLNYKQLCAPNVIVLQYPNSDATQSTQCPNMTSEYDTIYNVLKKNKRKMISESDIPLAILHSSVEKYCNPKFKFEEFLKRPQSKSDSSEILVLDTQDVTSGVRTLPKIISNIPIESDINPIKSKRATKIIPESYDSPSDKDLLINSNTCDSQGLITSTQVKDKEIREIVENAKEICLIKITKYIPETNTSFMSNMTEKDMQRDSQKVVDLRKITKFIPETNTSSISNITQKDTQHDSLKIVDSRKITKYIPETNTSFMSNETEKDMQRDSQKSVDSKEKKNETRDIEILKETMIANKGTPYIDLSAEESNSEEVQSIKCIENVNRIPIMADTLCELLDVDNERDKSTEVDKNSLVKRHKVISKEDRYASQSTLSTIKEDDHQKSKKRKKDSYQIENDEIDDELPTLGKKKIHLEDLTVEDTAKSPKVSSVPYSEDQENQSICDNLLRSTTSFLRITPNYKRFKKVYNNIPEQRITLNDMYVWEKCNISEF